MNGDIVDIEERRAAAGAGGDIRWVARGVVLFAAASLLLNATALLRSASLMEYGRRRDFCMGCITPVAAVSAFLRVDRLRMWIESIGLSEGERDA